MSLGNAKSLASGITDQTEHREAATEQDTLAWLGLLTLDSPLSSGLCVLIGWRESVNHCKGVLNSVTQGSLLVCRLSVRQGSPAALSVHAPNPLAIPQPLFLCFFCSWDLGLATLFSCPTQSNSGPIQFIQSTETGADTL